MFFRSIRWRIAVPYVLLILVAMLGLAFYVSNQLRQVRLKDLETQLLADARLMADGIESSLWEEAGADRLDALAKRWAAMLGVRVTIIGMDGTVLGESDRDRTQMENHLNRPEVQRALRDGQGSSIRFSNTVKYEMMYAAKAVTDPDEGEVVGFVRVALPLQEIEADVGRLRQMVLSGALLAALLAVLLAVVIAERIARPVRQLTGVAERMADGDLNARLLTTTKDEVGQLTRAFNDMAEQLRDEVSHLAEEQGRLAAVLENMADGVLITDEAGRVRLINPAAAWLLGVQEAKALGFSFAQVVRHHELVELWERCREQDAEQVEVVEFSRHGLFLQVIVTPFQEAGARGYLVILQDLTRIRRLETVRRDFISNISHELRTPLAGLKALVETLRDGALKDPPAAERFLNRMDVEVDTMTQMVQELLELSRVESGQVPLRLVPTPVADLLLVPIDRLRPQAERAELDVTVILPPLLPEVLADAERVQQVVTNLVHNAIKFTPAGGTVTVSAEARDEEVLIAVSDSGVGIRADDLPRIFERFYKVDRARSGRGTGLGLAIAKHVVQGHGGRIWVESVEGQGSTFYFTLPASK
jgi:two-component system phosphate regulon sensor histidine kinase PhoR